MRLSAVYSISVLQLCTAIVGVFAQYPPADAIREAKEITAVANEWTNHVTNLNALNVNSNGDDAVLGLELIVSRANTIVEHAQSNGDTSYNAEDSRRLAVDVNLAIDAISAGFTALTRKQPLPGLGPYCANIRDRLQNSFRTAADRWFAVYIRLLDFDVQRTSGFDSKVDELFQTRLPATIRTFSAYHGGSGLLGQRTPPRGQR